MTYEKGEVKICSDDNWSYTAEPGEAFLPHSCDEWVIGGAQAVRTLIADLQALLESGELREDT